MGEGQEPQRAGWACRTLALAGCVLLVAFPLRAWFALEGLPWPVKALWVVAFACALRWPWPSLLAFVALGPLLPIVPALERWPPVSLPAAWLWALLLASWMSITVGAARGRAHATAAIAWLLLASASLVVTLYPLSLARGGFGGLLADVLAYLRDDLVVAISQRPPLSPLLAWTILAEGIALFWLCRAAGERRGGDAIVSLAIAVATSASICGVWGVEQWRTGSALLDFWVQQDPFIIRVNGPFTDVNAFGAFLASSLPMIVAVALLRDRLAWRSAWFVGGCVAGLATLFTVSRAAWIAALVGVATFAGAVLVRRLGSWSDLGHARFKRAAVLVTVAALLIVSAATAWATLRDVRYPQQRRYADTVLYTLNLRAPLDERLKGRLQLWRAALNAMAARPLTGIGIGRFYKDVSAWAPDPAALIRPQENAHNYYLQIGAELGISGLVLFLVVLSGARGPLVEDVVGPPSVQRLGVAAACGVLAAAITLTTGHSLLLREGQFTFWPVVAIACASRDYRARLDPRRSRRAVLERRALAAFAVLLAVSLPLRMRAEVQRTILRQDVSGFVSGVYDEEQARDGRTFRWTGERAVFRGPADARVITIDVRGVAPFPQTVRIFHEGQPIQEVPILDHDWTTLRFVLPLAAPRERFRTFELRVQPTWHPPNDDRVLGVMVGAIGYLR